MKNAMTIDVEDYFHVSAFASTIKFSEWDGYACRVEANTEKLLDIFDDGGIKATFFVLGWVAERYPALVQAIAARGHEIACHGYSHRLVYDQSPAEFRGETERSKRLLEDLVQTPVNGYRAASYSITARSLWALDILVELGFSYDSSVFPVRHDRYGVPGSSREPYRLRTPAGYSILEFPLTTVELARYRLPVSGGGYFRLFPYFLTQWALASVNQREGRPFIFYLHPWEIDPEQPRIEAGWLSRFRHYNNLDRCEPRLRQLIADFEFGTVESVLQSLDLGEEQARG
jgi:polysaccharide deacetylase family protein (PEP-CTERM system associated)